MGQTKADKNTAVMAYINVPRIAYDVLTGDEPDEESRARKFNFLMSEAALAMAGGGLIFSPSTARHAAEIMEVPPASLTGEAVIEVLQRGMCKTPEGQMVISVPVDPAFVETLKNWARAGGHGEDWNQYVTRAFAWMMHEGWMCGVPTSAIALEFTPEQNEMLRELCGKTGGQRLTGDDVISLLKQALDESQPAPFMGTEVTQ